MPKPTFDQLKNWAENYPKLWNAGDKQAWIDNYKNCLLYTSPSPRD